MRKGFKRIFGCFVRLWPCSTRSNRTSETAPSLKESDVVSTEAFTPESKAQTSIKSIHSPEDVNELDLGEFWTSVEQTTDSRLITESTFLKAAWLLTLLCFRPEEVIQMSYDEGGSSNPITITVQVKPDWDIRSLFETLENKDSIGPGASVSDGTRLSQLPTLRHVCASALRYLAVPELNSVPSSSAKEQVQLVVVKDGNQTLASIRNSEKGSKDSNQSMLCTFQHVLHQITTRPRDFKIKDIDYCSEQDRREIQSLTHTVPTSNSNCCLHDLIVKTCEKYPTKLAVCSHDGDLTYQELNDLSLKLAHHLTQLGVGPETFVLSSFQMSTWAIVARLAILRAGGAYISIHSSDPPAYLDSVIQRTNLKVVLSDALYADKHRSKIEHVVVVTREWLEEIPLPNIGLPCPLVQPSNACNALFTSGSTGRPKAIVQEHRSYVAAINDYVRNLGLDEETRFLHFDLYAFDISNLEFLVPLLLGGCCCVPGPMTTIQDLADAVRELDANIAFLTPTTAIKCDPEAMRSLKILCVGGEPPPQDLLDRWAGSSTRVINQFGMGEAAVCCAYNDNVYDPEGSSATIGKPSSGTIWIVDPSSPNKLMPIGAVGEIVIEGPHLARGYLDQNHQASDRTKPAGFLKQIPQWLHELHPERTSSARLYQSGDLARWLHDGRIEYIGRKDTIIKLDGCRVDVMEVEHLARKALAANDAIVVDVLGAIDGEEDPRLAAFLYIAEHPHNSDTNKPVLTDASLDPLAQKSVAQIKEALLAVLPLYMVPKVYLLSTRVPRTASNKTDRRMIRVLSRDFYAQERERRKLSPSYTGKNKFLSEY